MKSDTTALVPATSLPWPRFADYVALTKPRVSVLVLFTVAAGYLLGGAGSFSWLGLIHTVFGTALVAAGASALNQFLERKTDAKMRRTDGRPLPAGRLTPGEVLVFGLALGIVGCLYLAVALPNPLAACIAGITSVLYVLVYTPLKQTTIWNTVIGAVPGALPPVIGWAAAHGSIGVEAVGLFLILFFWQVPHFLAIAWIYRDDYARAGHRMTPSADGGGVWTGRKMFAFCAALIATSIAAAVLLSLGWVYWLGAVSLGVVFLWASIDFQREKSIASARWVLHTSLIYLPAVLTLLVLDQLVF